MPGIPVALEFLSMPFASERHLSDPVGPPAAVSFYELFRIPGNRLVERCATAFCKLHRVCFRLGDPAERDFCWEPLFPVVRMDALAKTPDADVGKIRWVNIASGFALRAVGRLATFIPDDDPFASHAAHVRHRMFSCRNIPAVGEKRLADDMGDCNTRNLQKIRFAVMEHFRPSVFHNCLCILRRHGTYPLRPGGTVFFDRLCAGVISDDHLDFAASHVAAAAKPARG